MEPVTQLWPLPALEQPLPGLYLRHALHRRGTAESPYIYANFVASIDGRIAIKHPSRPGMMVPKEVANERDWRLFQELAAQADIIISSGRYLRDWADGRAQEILEVDNPKFADLRQWRQEQGLPPQPDIAILSRSLDFPIPDVLRASGRRVIVFTTADPDPVRVAELESRAGKVIVAGDTTIDGNRLQRALATEGYRTIYSSAGPRILHLLLEANVLDRLYMTQAARILAGDPFSSIAEGTLLAPAIEMQLQEITLDAAALEGAGQLFMVYDRTPQPAD